MNNVKKWIALVGLLALPVLAVLVMFRLGVISFGTSSSDEEAPVDLEALAALPYANFVAEPEERKKAVGVTFHDESLAHPGINLYCNHYGKGTGAYMIDMRGEIVHQWEAPDSAALRLATLDGSGNLYGVSSRDEGAKLVKLDWNSNVLFELPGLYHHDIQFRPDGSVVTLKSRRNRVRHGTKRIFILNNYLAFISADGEIIREISLFDVVRGQDVVRRILDEAEGDSRYPLDLLHTNTADVLEMDIPGFCRRGNILLCMRNLDLIFVYDDESNEIVWQYRGDKVWQHPHEPRILPTGSLMILDNGRKRGWSRVIEMDPITKQIVWEYRGDPPPSFFTDVRGSIQRLPNGNTLVTETESGRVFEITQDGEPAWEWYNPLFYDEKRVIVYRMKRLERSVVDTWMTGAEKPLPN
jgi:hypothetical protein